MTLKLKNNYPELLYVTRTEDSDGSVYFSAFETKAETTTSEETVEVAEYKLVRKMRLQSVVKEV